jgi:hypothetical protein
MHFAQVAVAAIKKIRKAAAPPRPLKAARFLKGAAQVNDAEPI